MARRLMRLRGASRTDSENAFSASLLSCIGALFLTSHPNVGEQLYRHQPAMSASLLVTLYLLTLWGIDHKLVKQIEAAFKTPCEKECVVTTAVRVADELSRTDNAQQVADLINNYKGTGWESSIRALELERRQAT